ncbi:hypothetical protein METHB2_930005 [Candidatus Methylobacter favarea]|uniref:Uncharacterized protein n=1 Tax=Candidatus Methylobacter favarea TaxID=2707345 RepID=A0A8S0WSQ8_9GAMM|nr:hypothetical protein METHB2_930005 [Candidatus Methylobacter favarea]
MVEQALGDVHEKGTGDHTRKRQTPALGLMATLAWAAAATIEHLKKYTSLTPILGEKQLS